MVATKMPLACNVLRDQIHLFILFPRREDSHKDWTLHQASFQSFAISWPAMKDQCPKALVPQAGHRAYFSSQELRAVAVPTCKWKQGWGTISFPRSQRLPRTRSVSLRMLTCCLRVIREHSRPWLALGQLWYWFGPSSSAAGLTPRWQAGGDGGGRCSCSKGRLPLESAQRCKQDSQEAPALQTSGWNKDSLEEITLKTFWGDSTSVWEFLYMNHLYTTGCLLWKAHRPDFTFLCNDLMPPLSAVCSPGHHLLSHKQLPGHRGVESEEPYLRPLENSLALRLGAHLSEMQKKHRHTSSLSQICWVWFHVFTDI